MAMDHGVAYVNTPTPLPSAVPLPSLMDCQKHNACLDCVFENLCIWLILTSGPKQCIDGETIKYNFTGVIRNRIDDIDTCSTDDPSLTPAVIAKYIHDFKLSDYNRTEPPSIESHTQTNVSFGFQVFNFSMEDYGSQFELEGSAVMEWQDHRLLHRKENGTSHSDHMTVSFSEEEIWVPRVKVVDPSNREKAQDIEIRGSPLFLARVDNDGTTNLTRVPSILRSKCARSPDFRKFPFDSRTCSIILSMVEETSIYNMDLRLLSNPAAKMKNGVSFRGSRSQSNWNIEDWKAARMEVLHNCCPEPIVELVFTFEIHRNFQSWAAFIFFVFLFGLLVNVLVGILMPFSPKWPKHNIRLTREHLAYAWIIFLLNLGACIAVAFVLSGNVGGTPLILCFLGWNSWIALVSVILVTYAWRWLNTRRRVPKIVRKRIYNHRLLKSQCLCQFVQQVYPESTPLKTIKTRSESPAVGTSSRLAAEGGIVDTEPPGTSGTARMRRNADGSSVPAPRDDDLLLSSTEESGNYGNAGSTAPPAVEDVPLNSGDFNRDQGEEEEIIEVEIEGSGETNNGIPENIDYDKEWCIFLSFFHRLSHLYVNLFAVFVITCFYTFA